MKLLSMEDAPILGFRSNIPASGTNKNAMPPYVGFQDKTKPQSLPTWSLFPLEDEADGIN
jgi:hypothetical protein